MKFLIYLLNLIIFPMGWIIFLGILSIMFYYLFRFLLIKTPKFSKFYVTLIFIIYSYLMGVISAYWYNLIVFYRSEYRLILLLAPFVLVFFMVFQAIRKELNRQKIKQTNMDRNFDENELISSIITRTMASALPNYITFLLFFLFFPRFATKIYFGLIENLILLFN